MQRELKLISEFKYFISPGKFPNFHFRTTTRVICNEIINKEIQDLEQYEKANYAALKFRLRKITI